MPRVPIFLISFFALLASIAAPGRSSADPIPVRIMEGSLNATGITATLSLVGEHGFTFEGFLGVTDGVFGPWNTCVPCEPLPSGSPSAGW